MQRSGVYRLPGLWRGLAVFCLLLPVSCADSSSAQAESPFDGERAYRDVETVVGIGERVPGTEGSKRAQEFIRAGLTEAGVAIREFPFEARTPMGVIAMNTVVGIVEGTSDEVLILSNHYDTKYFRDFTFVGANDAGSTTGWMLEMARVLGAQREGLTIWLVFFDGEEAFKEWTPADSLYGSRNMVKTLQESGEFDKLRAMINVDMIGDCDLGVFQDEEAPNWLYVSIWRTANRLGHGEHFLSWGATIADDHKPFRQAGLDAINLIDFRYGGSAITHDRTWHTPNDTLDKVCADSLQVVGDTVYHVLPLIDERFGAGGDA